MEFNQIQIKVGERIKKLREDKGISQQDLAAMCNFEKGNVIYRVGNGNTFITIE